MKKMKKIIALALPIVALALTSCDDDGAKTVTYKEARDFAVDKYDQYAFNAVPATFTTNLNTMLADIDVSYVTPSGGLDSFKISFGVSNAHVIVKDQYAYNLSSTVIDSVEKYYSDFVGIAVNLREESPIEMSYQLLNNCKTKIEMTTSHQLVGNFLIKLLQLGVGAIDSVSSLFGYIPPECIEDGYTFTNPLLKLFVEWMFGKKKSEEQQPDYFNSNAEGIVLKSGNSEKAQIIFGILNYLSLTVSSSSKSSGEEFNTYLTTDGYGFIEKGAFVFKSDFNISGLAGFKEYETETPKEGEKPIVTGAPYQFNIKGSVNFDFDIVCDILY